MIAVETILIQLINGLVAGSILALIAIGLTIIFGLMGIVNIAHGAFYALGAYVGYTILEPSGSNGLFFGLVFVPIVVALFGVLVEKTVLRLLYGRDLIYSLILTFGLMLVIHEIISIMWAQGRGGGGVSYPTPPPQRLTSPCP
jgi:branched-subunit amino acid ABC-type transport system permease component